MRVLKTMIVLMLFISIPVITLASTWQITIGGSGQDYSSAAVQTPDGGFVVVGNTYSFGNGDDDLLLLKVDPEGNIVWQKTYGGVYRETASAITQTSDGGFIVAGSTVSYGASDFDFWVLKFDAAFNILWQKYYAGYMHNTPYSIQETSDGGFILAGANGYPNADYWILKIDGNGTIVWQNAYDNGGNYDLAFSARETADGGYLVAGQTMDSSYDTDILILKLNAGGGLVWQKTYGGDSLDVTRSMEKTSDGNYIILGETNMDLLLMKIDPNDGAILWQKAYGGSQSESARTIRETQSGGLVLTGSTNSFGAGGSDGWILNLDADGEILWQKTYGGSGNDYFRYGQETSDGDFFIAGDSYSDNYDINVLKVNADGEIPGCASFSDTNIAPAVSNLVSASVAATVSPLSGPSGDTPVTPQDSNLIATIQCYDSPTPAFIKTGVVTNVNTYDWTTETLPNSFTAMVVVCSPVYDNTLPPMVVRVKDAIGNSFQLKMDRVDGQSGEISGITVHYLVVEEGVYNSVEHGITMEAAKMVSTVTDRCGSWSGQQRNYSNAYVNPVVIGQVMSYNDSGFSAFWSCGSSKKDPASASALRVGKHVGEDSDKTRNDETLGYIVIEAGTGSIGGLDYVVALGADTVKGIPKGTNPGYTYNFNSLASPTSAVVSQAAMDGGNGGWAILYGGNPLSPGVLELAIDEDQLKDTERNHVTEQVSYIVFEDTGN